VVRESQGKCKSYWKVREIWGENFTFLYSCCNANNSRAGVQSIILLPVVVVRSACRDSLLEVKLHFILSVAKCLQPFLKMYQVDKPMMPFLVPDLLKLVKDLLARFVQRDVVESLVTCSDVIGFDTNDTGKHCPAGVAVLGRQNHMECQVQGEESK